MFQNKFITEFITEKHVEKAIELFKAQVKKKSKAYSSIDFQLYKLDQFPTSSDFYKKLLKDGFYNNLGRFYKKDYFVPKGPFNVRTHSYLSFDLMILYYAVGFYTYELLVPKLNIFKQNPRKTVKTFYGYEIDFESPEKSRLDYLVDYKAFNKGINQYVLDKLEKEETLLVLKFDIQNYYDCLQHHRLFSTIDKFSSQPQEILLGFDDRTQASLLDLLRLVGVDHSNIGLPISSQNVISNFLADVYLWGLDDKVQELMQDLTVGDYLYSRYVDDFYIVINTSQKDSQEVQDIIFTVQRKLSLFLGKELGLQLNSLKTNITKILTVEDAQEFVKEEKLLSFSEIRDKYDFDDLEEHVEAILTALLKVQTDFQENGMVKVGNQQEVLFNSIFERQMSDYKNKPDVKLRLRKALDQLNPRLLHVNRKALISMFLVHDDLYKKLVEYILENAHELGSSAHVENLFEVAVFDKRYSGEFDDHIKMEGIVPSSEYMDLISRFFIKKKDSDIFLIRISPGNQILVGDQLKMLRLSFYQEDYNKSLNHLVNVIETLFYTRFNPNNKADKDFNRIDVIAGMEWATKEDVSIIDNVYELRNSNTISHKSSKGVGISKVTKPFFDDVLKNINQVLSKKF